MQLNSVIACLVAALVSIGMLWNPSLGPLESLLGFFGIICFAVWAMGKASREAADLQHSEQSETVELSAVPTPQPEPERQEQDGGGFPDGNPQAAPALETVHSESDW